MPDQRALHSLLNLQVDAHSPCFIVYSEKPSPRLNYVCEFIFKHVLKVDVIVTTDLNAWLKSEHYQINYSGKQQNKGLQVVPQALLFESGIHQLKPTSYFTNGLIYFYQTSSEDQATIHFDIFSAVFYFISRYEEWQAFEPDQHGRFEASASLLFQQKQHLTPVVDRWIYELKAALEADNPELIFPDTSYKAISTIDVDNLYAYRSKGLVRTLGACVKDLLKLDLKNLSMRLQVVSGLKPDPFDVYEWWGKFCKEQQVPLIFFFLFKTGTPYDRTIDPESRAFLDVFSSLKKNGALAGIHPSYHSAYKTKLLNQEAAALSEKFGEVITLSRQHFLRFDIRTTPQVLLQQGILADFTMGFASSVGFRAGTSHPFYYYDFKTEEKKDLIFVPFCAMDGAYFVYNNSSDKAAYESLLSLASEVKKVNGLFVTVFHERTFSNHLYPGFGTLYKNLHLQLKDI